MHRNDQIISPTVLVKQNSLILHHNREVKRVLFVPYALHDRDAYAKTARDKFKTLGSKSFCISFNIMFNI